LRVLKRCLPTRTAGGARREGGSPPPPSDKGPRRWFSRRSQGGVRTPVALVNPTPDSTFGSRRNIRPLLGLRSLCGVGFVTRQYPTRSFPPRTVSGRVG